MSYLSAVSSLMGNKQPEAPSATGDEGYDAAQRALYDQQRAEYLRRQQQLASTAQNTRVEGEKSLADYLRQSDITKAGGGKALGGGIGGPLEATGLSEQDFIELIARMKGNVR